MGGQREQSKPEASSLTLMEAIGQGRTTVRSPGGSGLRGAQWDKPLPRKQEQQQQESQGTVRRAGSADEFMVDLGLRSAISQPRQPSVEHLIKKKKKKKERRDRQPLKPSDKRLHLNPV